MSTEIDHRVTPSLHMDNVKQIEGYDTDEAITSLLAPTLNAFDTAYQGVRAVHDARDAATRNPTWNENQVIIETDALAQRLFTRIAANFDTARANLEKGIAHLEQELSQPVQARAAAPIAAEIRAHVKAMQTGKLHQFIKEAIEGNDHDTVTAVLGAPAYLSGLTPDFQKTYLRFWHEQQNPTGSARLRAMNSAKDLIERNAPLVFKELEKAVGAPPHKAKALREAKTAAEKHFVMNGGN